MVALLKRRSGMSMQEFIEYYEKRHAVLARELLPELRDYRRNYVMHVGPRSNAVDPDFDVITEMYFDDAAAAQAMYDRLRSDTVLARRMQEDEAALFDCGRFVILALDERVSPARQPDPPPR
jgi:uncharacterized protein (TIGR02118 family)